MRLFMILLVFLALAGWDVPQLLQKERRKDVVFYSLFMLVCLTLSVLVALHVQLPNPSKGLEAIFKPLGALLKPE